MPLLQQKESTDAFSLLDELIPLQDARHSDVVEYSVEVPFRYAECFAMLSDGRKARFLNSRCFVGWSSYAPSRTLLFKVNGAHLELDVEEQLAGQAPGQIHNITLEAMALRCADKVKKFIGIDGDLVLIPA